MAARRLEPDRPVVTRKKRSSRISPSRGPSPIEVLASTAGPPRSVALSRGTCDPRGLRPSQVKKARPNGRAQSWGEYLPCGYLLPHQIERPERELNPDLASACHGSHDV